MPQMTPAQARIIDPILSTIAQGYQNSEMVASALFPTVNVNLRAGQIITFGKEAFMLYQSQRAPGENTRRVRFGYAGAPFSLVDYSLEGLVPTEVEQEAQNGPGIDLGAGAVHDVSAIMALRLEKQSADIARTPGNYGANNKITLAGTDQWSDYGAVSDPIDDIAAAIAAVRAATGKRPNTVLMGAAVFDKLKNHPKVIERIKYTGRDVATPELLASLFSVQRVVVGDGIYSNDDGTQFIDIWGRDVVIAYTNMAPAQSGGLPSYGYTYQLKGYPSVEEPYYDRNAKSWIYPVTRAEQPVLASASAGFLITNAVA